MRILGLLLIFIVTVVSCQNSSESEPLEVFSKMNEKLYCGSAPSKKTHFKYLQSIGIKSIISVDGAKPDLELASNYGISYVHIPYGYDIVEKEQQLKLLKAFSQLSKPVFIHCHHGRHRAPVGGALILRSHYNQIPEELVEIVESLGTSKRYKGLYRSILTSQKFSHADWEGSELKDYEKPGSLTQEMARIDRLWDDLKDNEVLNEREHSRLLLEESFFELARDESDTELKAKYLKINQKLVALKMALASRKGQAVEMIQDIASRCKNCHDKNRN